MCQRIGHGSKSFFSILCRIKFFPFITAGTFQTYRIAACIISQMNARIQIIEYHCGEHPDIRITVLVYRIHKCVIKPVMYYAFITYSRPR